MVLFCVGAFPALYRIIGHEGRAANRGGHSDMAKSVYHAVMELYGAELESLARKEMGIANGGWCVTLLLAPTSSYKGLHIVSNPPIPIS